MFNELIFVLIFHIWCSVRLFLNISFSLCLFLLSAVCSFPFYWRFVFNHLDSFYGCLNGCHQSLFWTFSGIGCNLFGLQSDANPKKVCTYCWTVPLCEFGCMHAHNCVYIWGSECVFLCFNVCCFYCFVVAYHDVIAACMYVPVWGHLTNTMNVDIVFFFSSKGLKYFFFLLCAVIGRPKLFWWRDFMTVILGPWTNDNYQQAGVNGLILTLILVSIWNKTSVDYLNILGGVKETECCNWLMKAHIRDSGEELQEYWGEKKCNFSVNTVFCNECLFLLLVL